MSGRPPGPVGGPSHEVLRIDLHLHTWGSHDCLSDPERVLARARARGVERIAITDHNEVAVALDMAARHPEAVIPGEEVKTAEGIDVIGLYLRACIPKGTAAEETCRRIRDQGGIVYLPHPYARGKGGRGEHVERLVPHLDVIEVHNGRLRPPGLNGLAERVAERSGLLRGVGSDAHTLGEVGRSWVELPWHANEPGALLAALAKSASTRRETSHPVVHVASTWAKVRKRIPI